MGYISESVDPTWDVDGGKLTRFSSGGGCSVLVMGAHCSVMQCCWQVFRVMLQLRCVLRVW
jgi:hypothetical protein